MKRILSVAAMIMAVVILSINAFESNFYVMYREGTYFTYLEIQYESYTTNVPMLHVDFTPTLRLGTNSNGNKAYYLSKANTTVGIQMGSIPPSRNTDIAFRVHYEIVYNKDSSNHILTHEYNSDVAYYAKIDESVSSNFTLYDSLSGEKWVDLQKCVITGEMYKDSPSTRPFDDSHILYKCDVNVDGFTLADNWEHQ